MECWRRRFRLAFSSTTHPSPHAFRRSSQRSSAACTAAGRNTVKFSRKVCFRSIGETQPLTSKATLLSRSIKSNSWILDLLRCSRGLPSSMRASGSISRANRTAVRYWYNLHVVLVVADRARFRNEAILKSLIEHLQERPQSMVINWLFEHGCPILFTWSLEVTSPKVLTRSLWPS